MKPIVYVVSLTLLSLLFVSCDKEEEDFISEPNATSTIITGRICTPEGTPFAGIPIVVDYEDSGMGYHVLRHKAKATTDKNGNYRVFFNVKEEELKYGNFNLSMDFIGVSTELYLMPFSDSKADFIFRGKDKAGQTLECNIILPRRKEMQIGIVTEGADLQEGEYAIAHTCSYGSGWEWLFPSTSDVTVYEPLTITGVESNMVTFQCAVGEPNLFQLLYRKTSNGSYQKVNDDHKVDVTDNTADEMKLVYNLLSVDKFKVQLNTPFSTVFGGKYDEAAPLDVIEFQIVDGHGIRDRHLETAYIQPYDSIVWSADGCSDTYRVYDKASGKFASTFSTIFRQEGTVTNYFNGYRDGDIIHSVAVDVTLRNRDILCFNWDDTTVNGGGYRGYLDNKLDRKYRYSITNPYYTKEPGRAKRFSIGLSGSFTTEESLTGLLTLLETAGAKKVDIDFLTLRNIFSQLPKGDLDPVAYYENESSRILLLRHAPTESAPERYSLHIESKARLI